MTEMMSFAFERVENFGKGENAGYHHFLYSQCFTRPAP